MSTNVQVTDADEAGDQPSALPSRHRVRWVGVAAAVIVGAALVGAIVDAGGTRAPQPLALMVPSELPSGWRLFAGSGPDTLTPAPGRSTVYRDPRQLIGSSDVRIETMRGGGLPPPGQVVLIDGAPELDRPVSPVGPFTLRKHDPLRVMIDITVAGFPLETARRIADSVEARSSDAKAGATVGFLPRGLVLVSDDGGVRPEWELAQLIFDNATTGPHNAVMQYELRSEPADLESYVHVDGVTRPTTVRGHPALRVEGGFGLRPPQLELIWVERPGTMVWLTGNVDEATLQAFADSLVIDPERFDEMLQELRR